MARRRGARSLRTREPSPPSAVDIVRAYIRRINAHDPVGLGKLGRPKLRFVDATGDVYALTAEAWASYFREFPDYQIRVERIVSAGSFVAVFGVASGSYHGLGAGKRGASWWFPAAWQATTRSGKILEWRVYGDIEPMLKSAGLGRS